MPLQSRAVHDPDSTPEDDHIKWLRVKEIFEQHYEREQAAKKSAGKEESAKKA